MRRHRADGCRRTCALWRYAEIKVRLRRQRAYDKQNVGRKIPLHGTLRFLRFAAHLRHFKKDADVIEKSDDELSELLGEQSFDDIKKPEDEEWGDAHLQDLILFSLGELAEDDAIKCDCPDGGDFVVTPHPGRVEIACKKCGCKREISCEEGSIGAHVLFDCDTFRLLPPDDNKEDK